MSYSLYGQADWFYGKPSADSAKTSQASTTAPKTTQAAPKPAPAPKMQMAPPPPPQEEDEGGDLLLYAGIGIGLLTLVIITVKFLRSSDEDEISDVQAIPSVTEEPETKTIKIEIG